MRHDGLRRGDRTPDCCDVEAALAAVAPDVRLAALEASRRMHEAGIRHALIGGIAVGAHGFRRATQDVDFLIGEEGMVQHRGGVVTLHPSIPIAVGNVPIDFIGTENLPEMEKALATAVAGSIPVVQVEILVVLKLRANRMQDRTDVSRLIEAGVDADCVREYLVRKHLGKHPDLLARFDRIVAHLTET